MKTNGETMNSTEREQDYNEACELLTAEIITALGHSLNDDETVGVWIDASILDYSDAMLIVSNVVDDYDTAKNDDSLDVFGYHQGDVFKLNLYTA